MVYSEILGKKKINIESVVINEATYYGNNIHLVKAEKIIDNMKENINKKDNNKLWFENVRDLEKTFCDMFNFEKLYIELVDSRFAYTYPAQISYHIIIPFNKKYIAKRGKYGPQFKDGTNMRATICISYDVFGKFTNREILAILLHEIGHSFDTTLVRRVTLLNPIYMATGMFISLIHILTDTIRSNKLDRLFSNIFGNVYMKQQILLGKVITRINELLELIPGYKLFMIYANLQKINIYNILGYDGEVFSDSFATAFGYGPELSSALEKFNSLKMSTNVAKSNPILGIGKITGDIARDLVLEVIEPHPRTRDRIRLNIKYLKDSLKGINNPSLKKDIEAQIKDLEKISLTEFGNIFSVEKVINGEPDNIYYGEGKVNVKDMRQYISQLKEFYPNLDFE